MSGLSLRDPAGEVVDRAQDLVGNGEHVGEHWRWPSGAAGPVEECDPKAAFHLGQPLGKRRLTDPKASGSDGQRWCRRSLPHVPHLVHGQVRKAVIHKTTLCIGRLPQAIVSCTICGMHTVPAPATGRLGVLTPGMGAVASTFYAGVIAARSGLGQPIGSLTQMGSMPGPDGIERPISQLVPLADLHDLVFGGWDPITPNAMEAARTAGVLRESDLAPLSGELEGIVAMDAVFDQRWVSRLHGTRVKQITSKYDQALALIDDIDRFRAEHDLDRVVMVWCGSTEAYQEAADVHQTIDSFEAGLKADDPNISPSQIYAYAALGLWRAVRQWGTEPDRRPAMYGATGSRARCTDLREGLQDRPDPHEDHPGPGVGRPSDRGAWLVFHQHPREPGRRSVGRSRELQVQRSLKAGRTPLDPAARGQAPSCTATSTTWCGSTTTRRAATTKRAGTTSTFSAGWVTPCRSRSISSAATPSSLRHWCSTLRCSSIWPNEPARSGLQDWLSFYFKAPQEHPNSPINHDLFRQHHALHTQLAAWSSVPSQG